MFTILHSILLLICIEIAECCTQLTNNELVLVSKVNETIKLNVRNLFIKEDLSQLTLTSNQNDLFLQHYMFTHSKVNNSFQQIINSKVLRSNYDHSSLNQYILLNKKNNILQLYQSDKSCIGEKCRVPNFIEQITLDGYQCHDLDYLNQQTIILDCYQGTTNVFLIKSQFGLDIFQDNGEYIDPFIKRSIHHMKNNLILRVAYFDVDYKYSILQIWKYEQLNEERKLILALTINDEYLQTYFEDPNLILQISQIWLRGINFSILNTNQWFASFNISAFPRLDSIIMMKLEYDEIIVSFAYQYEKKLLIFQSQKHLYTFYNNTTNISIIENNNLNNQIQFTKNFFVIYQPESNKLSSYSLTLEFYGYLKIENSVFLLDQYEDEILAINNDNSIRIKLYVNKYLILKARSLTEDDRSAVLTQQLGFIEFCSLNIKYKVIQLNSTQAIPVRMNQLDQIQTNEIESFEIERFIDGPNITFYDINQEKKNNVVFNINFDHLILKNTGIIIDSTPIFIKVLDLNQLILYLIQLPNLNFIVYYCWNQMTCYLNTQTSLDFDFSIIENEFFVMNQVYAYFTLRNNQQIDLWFLQYSAYLQYQCTIYPDQDQTIMKFIYINNKIAVLESNQQIVFYSVSGLCSKGLILTNDFFVETQVNWNPKQIFTNQLLNLLFIRSEDQLIILKVNELELFLIEIIQLTYNSDIEIFSSETIFWIYYLETTLIESYNCESRINIYFKSEISLYNFVPNKFIHYQSSQYVYFYNTQDYFGAIYIYNMLSTSHNAFLSTVYTKSKIFSSVESYLFIGDSNSYYEIPNNIKCTVYYKDIYNPQYLVRVETQLSVSSFENKSILQYPVDSGLVNPYTSIVVNTESLNLAGLINQQKPIGSCQEKYSWYTGQVVDIGMKSQQLKLIKPLHLLNMNLCNSGVDSKFYYNSSLLILNSNNIIKLDMKTQGQQMHIFDVNYTFYQIVSVHKELIFISSISGRQMLIYTLNCTSNFQCKRYFPDLPTQFSVKSIRIYSKTLFIISDSIIDIYNVQSDNISYVGNISYLVNYSIFYDVSIIRENYYYIYAMKQNELLAYLYEIGTDLISLIDNQSMNMLTTLKSLSVVVDPKTKFMKVLLISTSAQQGIFSFELLFQSTQHSHFILQIVQICQFTNTIICKINKLKVLSILQSYGGWYSNKLQLHDNKFLIMTYNQAQTYLAALYRLELEYIRPIISSTLILGAIQYTNIYPQQFTFYPQDSQLFLLTNVLEASVYALFEISNTTKFCIQSEIQQESIKIALKNSFNQVDTLIEIKNSADDIENQINIIWLIFWIVFGFISLFTCISLLLCCRKKDKKDKDLLDLKL